MKTKLLLPVLCLVLDVSCGNPDTTTEATVTTTNTTTNNNTIEGDTSIKESTEEKIASLITNTAKEFYDEWEREDSIRDANEPHKWVYVIGDSYDDEDLAAQEYDRLKESEPDVYVFRKKRKKFYLIKGIGLSSRKQLDDSLDVIQNRLKARLDVVDLSKVCRKLPINTDPIKYKVDGEKKYADCKKCE